MKKAYLLLYGILSLIILFSFYKGYLLTLDMVFADNSNPEDLIYGIVTPTNIPLLHIILGTLNFILPFSIIQKILLFLIFFLSGISMYKLVNTKKRLPKYF